MIITELLKLIHWYEEGLKKSNLVQNYNSLVSKLNTVIQANVQSQPYDDEKNLLLQSLNLFDLSLLSMAQIQVLEKLNVIDSIGEVTSVNIIKDFKDYNKDIVTIRDSLNNRLSLLNTATSTLINMKNSLKPITSEDDFLEDDEYIIMRVKFDNEVAIKNMSDLKKWTSQLELLMRSVAEINNQRVEDVEVISAEKGSLIYVLKVTLEIAKDLGIAVAAILGCVKLHYDIQLKKEEIKKLKLGNEAEKNILIELNNEQKRNETETSKKVVSELIKSTSGDNIIEAANKLEKGISVLIKLIKGGGDIDIISPTVVDEDDVQDSNNESPVELEKFSKMLEIREQFKEIKSAQNNIKLLESNFISNDNK